MRAAWLILVVAALIAVPAPFAQAETENPAAGAVEVEFSNPSLSPSHWTLTLRRDGSGHFHSERGKTLAGGSQGMDAGSVDREVELSAKFTDHVFDTAQRHKWFNQECDSHLKLAFQGWKTLSYKGAEGQGKCTFNYSKDKDIQTLGDALVAVSETLLEGARLEMLLQHDRLGLDKETEYLVEAWKDGRVQQLGAIRGILERLAGDEDVMDRVRKRAKVLLAQVGT